MTYRHRILRVQLLIQEQLDQELPLDRLAREAHLSPFHFHRIFKAMVGEGVGAYVRRLRLERAALLLKITDRAVTEIGFESGYGTLEAFSRAFRQMFGVAPSAYRKESHGPTYILPREAMAMSNAALNLDVVIQDVPGRTMALIRRVGPYNEVGAGFQQLMAWAGPRGLLGPNSEMIGIGHDDPDVTPADKLRYDCALTVPEGTPVDGEIQLGTIEGGPHAIVKHVGPYETLAQTYRWICGTWLPSSNRELRNMPMFEIYRNDPSQVPAEELITEIYVPLKPI